MSSTKTRLRKGHSAVIAIGANDQQAQAADGRVGSCCAPEKASIAARDMWLVGLRDFAEESTPTQTRTAANFREDERYFRVASRPPSTPQMRKFLRGVCLAPASANPLSRPRTRREPFQRGFPYAAAPH